MRRRRWGDAGDGSVSVATLRRDVNAGGVLADGEVDTSWSQAIRVGIGLWFVSWCAYLLFATVVTAIAPSPRLDRGPTYGWIFRVFAHWDSGHFWRVAAHGYLSRGRHDVNVAFFPGYPLAGRYLATLLGLGHTTLGDYQIALALIAWSGAAVASVLLYKLAAESLGARVATVSVIVLLAGPYSHFLMASYSEAPFLAFALAAWLAARHQAWIWAGIWCALATFMRVNGIFLLAGIVVMYVLAARASQEPLVQRRAAGLLLPLGALLIYFGWIRAATGSWGGWFIAQRKGWDRYTTWPWRTLHKTLENLQLATSRVGDYQTTMELLFAGLLIAALVLFARRGRWPEFTYVGLTALSLMTSSFYQSVPRSTVLAFPIVIMIARWLVTSRHRVLVWGVCATSTLLLVINTATFVRGYWAG
ncbi:Gpi18-like mannosyltransferase [Jatrophihabitans sp. GAS493]|uniref:mannosyltransferase family protein n=1 Tax=Jatrophihabitans sp. GAS493 TaxID=1907575 RepID=UPI000BBF7104|nr:mannosyltransferase family protein [Jatrophihabitans sp. GAS493]SOD72777.1 Gpi18-like mannosyltransferase [Jatrophihabitans sp. GAS493]